MASQKEITPQVQAGSNSPRERMYSGTLTLGASGAVASSVLPSAAWTVAKNAAAGRYNFTIHRGFGRILNVLPSIEGPASAAFGNTNANLAAARNVNAAAGTFDVQLLLASTGADTDGASGYVVRVTILVSDYTGP